MTAGGGTPEVAELLARATAWMATDPDPRTREAVAAMIDAADPEQLAATFGSRLAFGTAGLRGPVGPGPTGMNRLLVRQTAAGLARHLLGDGGDASVSGVVVGHDARRGSDTFAADVAEVISAHGIPVHLVDGPAPTPFMAFALRHLGAAAAVVITASHNPPRDNGIKVYASDGAQIVAPADASIAAHIEEVAADGRILPTGDERAAGVHHLGGAAGGTELVAAYLDEARRLVPGPPATPRPLAVTALHGVGADLLELTLHSMGHGPIHHVASQRAPDPEFPTVTFPNPEEPGALDELLSLAERVDAVLALANDPDADRVALAAPRPSGEWRALSGDETGALLAHHLLHLTRGAPDRLFATTVVSSRLLGAMAAEGGCRFEETLTGFKWLCRPGLAHPEWTQVMLYEEALGYAIGPRTRDKDGITAALVAADLACTLAAEGRTVWDVLDDLARRHGAHVTRNASMRLAGDDWRSRLAGLTASLVEHPPDTLGGVDVVHTEQPAPDVVRLWLADDTRVVLRPSGTEPKFKYYCEAIESVADGEEPDAARSRAGARLDPVEAEIADLLG